MKGRITRKINVPRSGKPDKEELMFNRRVELANLGVKVYHNSFDELLKASIGDDIQEHECQIGEFFFLSSGYSQRFPPKFSISICFLFEEIRICAFEKDYSMESFADTEKVLNEIDRDLFESFWKKQVELERELIMQANKIMNNEGSEDEHY